MEANLMLDFYLASYKQLQEVAQAFPQNLGTTPPEDILKQSQELERQQKELRKQDQLIIQALNEADPETIDWDKVKECQKIIQHVVDILDTISIKAHTQKAMLAQELKKISKGLNSLKGYSNPNQESGTLLKRSF